MVVRGRQGDRVLHRNLEIRTTGVPTYSRFLALGDSYSAGIGNQDSKGILCGRSPTTRAYLAKQSWDPIPELIACSGATSQDVELYQLGLIPWHVRGRNADHDDDRRE